MFFKSIFKVGIFTLISRVFGLVRDTTTAIFLGASAYSDAFVIALKLPNVFRRLFAEGSLNSVFVPIFAELIDKKSIYEAKKFSNEVYTVLFFSLFVIIILMEIFMPQVLWIIAPGLSINHPEDYQLAIDLSRITLPYLFFISLASVYASILNSFKKFMVVAALPIVLNITIIGFFWASKIINLNIDNAYYGSAGITVAGILQFLIMLICVCKINWRLSFVKLFKVTKATKIFFKRVFPIIITAGVYQINIFIDLTIASWLEGGAITYLYYGDRLNQLPLAIIGIATSTVIVPFIVGKKNTKEENLSIKSNAVLYGMLLGFPAVLSFFILGKEIIIMLFNYGKFNLECVQFTYYVLCGYAIGLIPNILIKVMVAIFYAEQDCKTPFYINLFILIFNIILAVIFAKYWGVVGIALATSVSSILSFLLLGFLICKKGSIKIDWYFLKELFLVTFITCVIFFVAFLLKDWVLNQLTQNFGRKGLIGGVIGLILGIIIIWLTALKIVKSQLYGEISNLIKRKRV